MRHGTIYQNQFKEGIECFHPEKGKAHYSRIPCQTDGAARLYGYLIFDFKLKADWEFDGFTIEKSIEVLHDCKDQIGQEGKKSFISPVLMPDWVTMRVNPHRFLLGLSAVCSFCLGRPVYSPKDSDLVGAENRVDIRDFLRETSRIWR